jgi:histone H3/H4
MSQSAGAAAKNSKKKAAAPAPAAEPAAAVKVKKPRVPKPVAPDAVPAGLAEDAVQKAPRKPSRFHPGTVAARETKKARKSTGHVVAAAGIDRSVREVLVDLGGADPLRVGAGVVGTVRQTVENFITSHFAVQSLLAGVHKTQTATAELGIAAELIQKLQRGQPIVS